MPLQLAVLFNDDRALARGEAADSLAVASVEGAAGDVVRSLRESGWEARAYAVPQEPRALLDFLGALECDLVFNLVESLGGDARREASFAAVLDLLGLPYTGSRPRAMTLCLEKPLARVVLQAAGIAVPRGVVLERGDEPLGSIRFPLILKPSREDASHGIALESVVEDERAARERARYVIERYAQPALAEEYVAGREFNLTVLGSVADARALPPAEIDFTGFPEHLPRIVTYGGKWIDTSVEWQHTHSIAPRSLAPSLAAQLERAALGAYRALDLQDYGRVDLRVNERGEPFVIDVNPNPDLSKDAGLALTAGRCGISHAELLHTIVQGRLARERDRAPAAAAAR
jgi:D-alanine-D-alanine ligase